MAQGKIEQYERVDFIETYGIIPYSIWDLTKSMKYNNQIESVLRDKEGGTREASAKYFDGAGPLTKFTATTSYFNAFLARCVYRSYSKLGDTIFDPFSSIVRPYVAAIEGRKYIGCEVRKDECDKANSILSADLSCAGSKVLNIDCRQYEHNGPKVDAIFTCPPYWSHERYSDLSGDMSNIEKYGEFLNEMGKVAALCHSIIKADGYVALVTSDFRDYTQGRKLIERLVQFSADMVRVFEGVGFILYDKVVIAKPLGSAPARVKLWNNRKTVRIHEDLLIFKVRQP
jgi:DNA modification methylase